MADSNLIIFVIYTTLVIIILVVILLFSFIVYNKKRNKQQLEFITAKLAFEQELRQVETEVCEYVMGQFAQELHDNIGQLLTAMHIQIENQKIDHPTLIEGLKPVEIYLDEVNQQLRLLSRTFNNDYLGHIGLFAAIQLEVERLTSLKRFNIQWKPITGSSNLDKNQELMVFRIFQEIVQNALRHSSAKEFKIEADNKADGFNLMVQDDGKGFSVEETLLSKKASGLRNIIKRAQLASLECKLESSLGHGCTYQLTKTKALG